MASKTGKKANAALNRSNAPVAKDDGTRWLVVRDGHPVYLSLTGEGVTRAQAQHLASGLLRPAEVVQVAS